MGKQGKNIYLRSWYNKENLKSENNKLKRQNKTNTKSIKFREQERRRGKQHSVGRRPGSLHTGPGVQKELQCPRD